MVSANLLAEIDTRLRTIMSHVNEMKRDKTNLDRAFGGINLLLVGDFQQLDPTGGTPINAIPTAWIRRGRKYAPGATDEHGQYLFWGQDKNSVQGVIMPYGM